MAVHRIVAVGTFAILLAGAGTQLRAQQVGGEADRQYAMPGYSSGGASGGAGASAGTHAGSGTAPVTCPLSTSAQAATANCVIVVIPSGAAGMGTSAFGANPLSLSRGVTIIWFNQDTTYHTVTANDGSFDSGPIAPGDYYARTFNSAGSFPYYCSIHGQQSMSGTVSVSSTNATPVPCPSQSCASSPTPPNVVPAPIPVPRPSPRPSPSRSPSPSPRPSPSPSLSPSPSPSPSAPPSTSPSGQPSPHVSGMPSGGAGPSPSGSPQPGPAPSP